MRFLFFHISALFFLLQPAFAQNYYKRDLALISKANMLFGPYRESFLSEEQFQIPEIFIHRNSKTFAVSGVPAQPAGAFAFFDVESGLWVWENETKSPYPNRFATVGESPAEIKTWIISSTSTRVSEEVWILAVAHEQFHRMQMQQPLYFRALDSLAAQSGNTTGDWLCAHPFSWKQEQTFHFMNQFRAAVLHDLESGSGMQRTQAALNSLEDRLSASDFSWFSAQLWMEGFAKFAELEMIEQLHRTQEYRNGVENGYLAHLQRALTNPAEAEQGSAYFYQLGIPLGKLLNRERPDWKKTYLKTPFNIVKLIEHGGFSHNRIR